MDNIDSYIINAKLYLKARREDTSKVEEVKEVRKGLAQAKRLRTMYLRNSITYAMLDVITHSKNIDRMMTPISMKELSMVASKLPKETLDLNNPKERYRAFELVQHGKRLVGIFANHVKSMAYMVRAGINGTIPKLREKEQFKMQFGEGEKKQVPTFDKLAEYDIFGKQT